MKKISLNSKRGDIQLSFGMIFSIILIVIFIAFAFWGIKKFMGWQDQIKIAKFVDNLRTDVNKMWESTKGSQQINYSLPPQVRFVCFAQIGGASRGENREKYGEFKLMFNEKENMFFYPTDSAESLSAVTIENIDIVEITKTQNPFCIENKKGKISLTLKKEYGFPLVLIEK